MLSSLLLLLLLPCLCFYFFVKAYGRRQASIPFDRVRRRRRRARARRQLDKESPLQELAGPGEASKTKQRIEQVEASEWAGVRCGLALYAVFVFACSPAVQTTNL